MIGQLRGKLIEKQPPHLMLDVQGVGYLLQAPLSTFFVLPAIGQEITLRTHFVVREDAQLLYGFVTKEECQLFQELIKVNGVGPKVALALLSGLSRDEFIAVIMSQDSARLKGIPGVGPKTAQRILVEMQDRLIKLAPAFSSAKAKRLPGQDEATQSLSEAVSALVALGYKPSEALHAAKKVESSEKSCEQIIKEALQGLAKV